MGRLSKLWAAKQHSRISAEFSDRIGNHPFVLMVGTIELRKNVPTVLAAWKQVRAKAQRTIPPLVLVGKWGQGAVEIQEMIKLSDNINGKIVVLSHVSDHMLAELYRGCLFSIYMSHYEGWGLPIGESLWFGKRVLASNTSAMPEAGGNMVIYADPTDIHGIADCLFAMITNPNSLLLGPLDAKQLRTISQFGDIVCQALETCLMS